MRFRLDPVGMLLNENYREVFYTWQNCLGDPNTRHIDLNRAVIALYDHLCILDDMYDMAGVEFDIRRFRTFRRMVNRRQLEVGPHGEGSGYVLADQFGAVQNALYFWRD